MHTQLWTITDYSCRCFFLNHHLPFLYFFFFCKDSCAAKQLEVKALKGLDYKESENKTLAILPTGDRTKALLAGFILHNSAVFLDEVNNLTCINIKIRPWSPQCWFLYGCRHPHSTNSTGNTLYVDSSFSSSFQRIILDFLSKVHCA